MVEQWYAANKGLLEFKDAAINRISELEKGFGEKATHVAATQATLNIKLESESDTSSDTLSDTPSESSGTPTPSRNVLFLREDPAFSTDDRAGGQ